MELHHLSDWMSEWPNTHTHTHTHTLMHSGIGFFRYREQKLTNMSITDQHRIGESPQKISKRVKDREKTNTQSGQTAKTGEVHTHTHTQTYTNSTPTPRKEGLHSQSKQFAD